MDHTKEPWTQYRQQDHSGNDIGYRVVQQGTEDTICHIYAPSEANARRIVACVNACVGLSNELFKPKDYTIKAHIEELERRIKEVELGNKELRRMLLRNQVRKALNKGVKDGRLYHEMKEGNKPEVYYKVGDVEKVKS